ncbi:TetR/AcrR family transcriptional regulator [Ruegeria lacuscaerulensis]|uniref:TetR/AcrR family transcriptional regulator n=1 Tax=Ruegeria lacuscaerulensis TaxID=55218 RepID=UPI00147DC74F|nr:TetR/AcrR family transcriptional regulator [Ruegeria lacuscaerulensis]
MAMNEKNQKIVEAAFGLFAHYGVAKTSMTEIAAASKVSRQTLYKAYESKEDLIFAALLQYAERTKADIESACAIATDLEDRLEILFKFMCAAPFDAMQRFPHLDEIMEIGDNLSPERVKQIRGNYLGAIGVVLAPFEKDLTSAGIKLPLLQNTIKSMFTQIKRDASDVDQLKDLFDPLRAMVVFCVQGKP